MEQQALASRLLGGTPEQVKRAFRIAWPAVLESFFIALAGLIDSLMVSALGPAAVAAVQKMMLQQQLKLVVLVH